MNDIIHKIEEKIDSWLIENLDKTIPRNRYIYHCNLAYIDLVIGTGILFTPFEKHYMFSLTYNTYIAHKELKEEEHFNYIRDEKLYNYACKVILQGVSYSFLCDIFPLLHSKKGNMYVENKNIHFKLDSIPKKNMKYLVDNERRKVLSYLLQMLNGKYEKNKDADEKIVEKLTNEYIDFWNENMNYDDYEPYTEMEYGGLDYFFVNASMRRFNKLYKCDFKVLELGSPKMMIMFSPNGVNDIRKTNPSTNDELYKLAFDDNVYKPIGNNNFPKLNLSEAPLNKTKDGYIFANPLMVLFNDSIETKFLNYLRKADNQRYLRVKDKIKERTIPIIEEMVKYKFPKVKIISNFNVKMPFKKNDERECDILLIDDLGNAIYLEIKHFYNPHTFSEIKRVDNELNKALKKIPEQLKAIKYSWENIKRGHGIDLNIKKIYGIIISYNYLGYDVEFDEFVPIIDISTLYKVIAESNNIEEIFLEAKLADNMYSKIEFIDKNMSFNFAGYKFNIQVDAINPIDEMRLNSSYKKMAEGIIKSTTDRRFKKVEDVAKNIVDRFYSN